MATRSHIAYKDKKTNKIHMVYCHYDGYLDYTEVGPGKVLQGLIRKINRETITQSALS